MGGDLGQTSLFPKKLEARPCIDEQVLLARHGGALLVALRFFGTGAEMLFSMALLGRIVRAGPVALGSAKPPSVLRMLTVFLRESFPRKPAGTWAGPSLLRLLESSRWGLGLLGRRKSVNFLDRFGYGYGPMASASASDAASLASS